jgi:glucan phosphoethanolaminetransferase (alkaline phosphatase superfamily)
MNPKKQDDGRESRLILFPEIIGVSVIAVLLPFPLVHLLLSGRALAGFGGFLLWFAALFFTVRFIRRRQYGFACLPMLVLLCLFYLIQKWMSQ